MRITQEQLAIQPKQVIDLLEIISIEGQQYMARLSLGDDQFLLSDKKGVTRLFPSAWTLQDTLASFAIRETQVVHPSAYHEMIGMEPANIEPLRISVQKQWTQRQKT
ncbi:MAG TPA: hypothetical protein ENH62_05680 [Marinobacter sp.]|uniref:Uncharacterized protein n=2 Tax=root TaxID=1 RepID=A0A831R4G3_9GAMM|nr:DUF6482 family protein [Marinobacter antarcticus]HDZ37761.1 hypothetical protein [Marinobacter sp.]HEA51846.1 hypothetical protein [Marinobacter antarcticus]